MVLVAMASTKKQAAKAGKKSLTPKMIANAVARMTPMLDGTYGGAPMVSRTNAGKTTFSQDGVDTSSLEVVGDELVVEFLAPSNLAEFAPVMRHYEPVAGKRGWLRFRRPATSSPTPSLEANLGAMLGAAELERANKRKKPT